MNFSLWAEFLNRDGYVGPESVVVILCVEEGGGGEEEEKPTDPNEHEGLV